MISADAREQWFVALRELRSWETLLVEVAGYAKRPAPVVKNGRVQFGQFAGALDVTPIPTVNEPTSASGPPELMPDAPESDESLPAQ